MNHNLVQVGGNLTRDIETKTLPSGTCVADFSIAVNRVWKNDAGEKKEEVTFVDCTAFARTAENIAKYFAKGDSIFIQGRLKQESWNDKETGKKRYKMKVIADSIEFIGGKKNDAATKPDTSDKQAAQQPDEVPF